MGTAYSIYKEKEDEIPIYDGEKWAGIPLFLSNYGLKQYNHIKEKCIKKNCILCYDCNYNWRYKITRTDIPKLVKDMECNKELFSDLMQELGQDYFWIEIA